MTIRLSVCNERGHCSRVKFTLTDAGPYAAEVKTWEVQDLIDAIDEADTDLQDQMEMRYREAYPEKYRRFESE